MPSELTTEPIEIAEQTYWVGRREPGGIFYANPYLRVFRGAGERAAKRVNLIIDPGSSSEFAVVQSKCAQVLGGNGRINAVFINHQDPDVGSIVGPLLNRFNPKARLLCSEETWRLVHFFNIKRDRYICTDPFLNKGMKLPTGHKIIPVASPYCHFVGATMLYDSETRVLFTGDLFGGLTDKDAEGLFADESDWAGMRAFHQLYMPANAALRYAVAQIRRLNPAPLLIAPQHGRILRGPWIEYYLDRIDGLLVGIDLLDDRDVDEATLHGWSSVLTRVMDTARSYLGADALARITADPELDDAVEAAAGSLRVLRRGKWVIERTVHLLTDNEATTVANTIRYEAIFAASELDLPSPNIELAEEGAEAMGFVVTDDEVARSSDDSFEVTAASPPSRVPTERPGDFV